MPEPSLGWRVLGSSWAELAEPREILLGLIGLAHEKRTNHYL